MPSDNVGPERLPPGPYPHIQDPLPVEIAGAAVVNQMLSDLDQGRMSIDEAREWYAELQVAGFLELAEMLRTRLAARDGG